MRVRNIRGSTRGGLLRDVLAREEPLVFKPGEFYVLVALAGSALFVALTRFGDMPVRMAAELAIGLTCILRLLTVRYHWRTQAVKSFLPEH